MPISCSVIWIQYSGGESMGLGKLKIITTTADKALPLAEVTIEVYDPQCGNTTQLTSDENGNCDILSISAPDKQYSLDENYSGIPYSIVDIFVAKANYEEMIIRGVQIFDEITALEEIDLAPITDIVSTIEVSIGDNNLLRPSDEPVAELAPVISSVPYVLAYPIIPKYVTVHLGAPQDDAQNVTVTFKDYIKNVASSEIYPTWPYESLRANIYCQISFLLNRVYTEWYRSRGYNFDITNTTAYDQYFVYGRNIFDSVSEIVDDIFNEYIRQKNSINPFIAQYCDGKQTWCPGLKQWGTVTLAEDGNNAFEILVYYYGSDIEITTTDRIEGVSGSYPGFNLKNGVRNDAVAVIQTQLNRISINYPLIPANYPVDGIFGSGTQEQVETFQRQFNLTDDGIVGNATWYKISYIYVAVTQLAELTSEGIDDRLNFEYPGVSQREGDRNVYVQEIQFFIQKMALFTSLLPKVTIDGNFGAGTKSAVIAFQRLAGLTQDGIVGRLTWSALVAGYQQTTGVDVPTNYIIPEYPGTLLRLGSRGEDVSIVQFAINAINQEIGAYELIGVDGIFGAATQTVVINFQERFELSADGIVGPSTWNTMRKQYSVAVGNPISFSDVNYQLALSVYMGYTGLIYNTKLGTNRY